VQKHRSAKFSARKKIFGPGRSQLRKAQSARHHGLFNLWYHYSPRLRRDVVLKSDVAFAHFCWLEGDPSILRYELDPDPVIVASGADSRRTQFDALVEFRTGRPQLREFRSDDSKLSPREVVQREAQEFAATAAGFDYLPITRAALAPHDQLIRNWRCALAFQTACRELVLDPFCAEIVSILKVRRRSTIEDALRQTDPVTRPIHLAALFRSLQEGVLASNLDSRPLCASTQVWAPEAADG
jgi:hypothetical protein